MKKLPFMITFLRIWPFKKLLMAMFDLLDMATLSRRDRNDSS